MQILVMLTRLGLGLVLLKAGLAKLQNFKDFLHKMNGYGILPFVFLRPVVPRTGLITGLFTKVATLLATVLLSVFSIAIIIGLLRKKQGMPCGCGSSRARSRISGWLVLRNAAFIGGLIFVLVH